MEINIIIGAVSLIAIIILLLQVKKVKSDAIKIEQKYSVIIDVDKEIDKKRAALVKDEAEAEQKLSSLKNEMGELKTKYQHASEVFSDLSHKSNLLKDDLDAADHGIYEPHFDFDTSEKFKEEIKEIRNRQKLRIKNKTAILGGDLKILNISVAKINDQKKLMLRAFNGECNNFVSKVQWNNANRMRERIQKSAEAITKTAELEKLTISPTYVDLKITELELAFEYKSKKREEQEEQRRVKEQMREEARVQKELEKARKDAEKEEKLIHDALKTAKEQMESASEEQKAEFEAKLAELQEKLLVAEESNKRAVSMAQQTKSGHVYVISNIGSFGEDVYKIGMTRRLEPLDRVKELGDASVPFKFDVHAMIYSDDAPALENELHKEFENSRVNLVNRRREYFNVPLDLIEEVVLKNNSEIEFIKVPEAYEYRESIVIRNDKLKEPVEIAPNDDVVSVDDLFN